MRTLQEKKEHLLFNFHPTQIFIRYFFSAEDGWEKENSSHIFLAVQPHIFNVCSQEEKADTKQNTRKFNAICETDKKYIKQIKIVK